MKPTEWENIASRIRREFPRMVLPDETVAVWYDQLQWYPAPLVEAGARRMAFASDRTQPSLATLVDYVIKTAEEQHEKAKHTEQRVEWEAPRIEPEQEARWVKALAFCMSAPSQHPARVWNREQHEKRQRGETVDAEEHLVGIEKRARELPLTGIAAATYRRLTKQGKIGVLGALQRAVAQ